MKYYRNVKVAHDATENRKQEDEFDEMGDYIRGGLPMVPIVTDVEDPDFEAEIGDDLELDGDEVAEVFDIDEAMKIDAGDDEL